MKKQLTLRLIESNDKPIIGDIFKNIANNLLYIWNNYHQINYEGISLDNIKVIKPIAISDEEITKDNVCLYADKYIKEVLIAEKEQLYFTDGSKAYRRDCKKIELLPEHFSSTIKQAIVDGKLKDGDSIEIYYHTIGVDLTVNKPILLLDSNNYAIITIPESEEYKCRKCGGICKESKALLNFHNIQESNSDKEFVTKYLNCLKCEDCGHSFIPADTEVESKEELDSRRSSAYEYVKIDELKPFDKLLRYAYQIKQEAEFDSDNCITSDNELHTGILKGIDRIIGLIERQNKPIESKPMYSEDEVKELCENAAIYAMEHSHTHHYDEHDSDREFDDDYDFNKWFEENKKK